MMDRSSCQIYDAGFTLLELLVTLALLSLLSLAMFSSIHYGTRIWTASRTATANTENIRAAQQTIAEIIGHAYPKFETQDATHARIAFDGTAAQLRLLAPDPHTAGALSYASIFAEPQAGSTALVVARTLELSNATTPAPLRQVLLTGLQTLAFSYFGALKPGTRPEWQARWQNHTRPPLLVRVHATFVEARNIWPDLTISPRVAADVGCTLDSVTKSCQGR